jgi:uncharacterized repeat protein (TIGR04138 family)
MAMQENDFHEAIEKICDQDPRYSPDAYLFVREALDFTVKALERPTQGTGRHVTGKELLEGIRRYALQQFGPMTVRVFNTWGIQSTADFGEMVFNMVSGKILGKTDQDSKADFANGYEFHEAFTKPFLPAKPKPRRTREEPPVRGTTGQPEQPQTPAPESPDEPNKGGTRGKGRRRKEEP